MRRSFYRIRLFAVKEKAGASPGQELPYFLPIAVMAIAEVLEKNIAFGGDHGRVRLQ
jgi:hypothetical protein